MEADIPNNAITALDNKWIVRTFIKSSSAAIEKEREIRVMRWDGIEDLPEFMSRFQAT